MLFSASARTGAGRLMHTITNYPGRTIPFVDYSRRAALSSALSGIHMTLLDWMSGTAAPSPDDPKRRIN
jgi:hypothetical protein